VYWGDTSNGTVYRVPIGGGTPVPIVTGAGSPYRMAVDSQNLYWVEQVVRFRAQRKRTGRGQLPRNRTPRAR